MITVCKGCTDRFIGCHGTCTKYIEQKKIHVAQLEEIKREHMKEAEYRSFNCHSRLESIRRKQLRDGRGRK